MGLKLRKYKEIDYQDLKNLLMESGLFDPVWDTQANLSKKTEQNPKTILIAKW